MSSTHLAPWTPTAADPFDARKAAHLLRRAGFGAPPDLVAKAVKDELEATVEGLFDPAEDEEQRFAQTFEAIAGQLVDFSEVDQLRAWWAYRMVRTRAPLREKLALFWHGHFATSIDKVEDAHVMHRQVETLRRLAWGNVRDLVLAMAKDPAMIAYLDGGSNSKAHPNENFGRELMELFTCGIGHYTEDDVKAAARAFTGWHRDGAKFAFSPDDHDDGRKRFLGKSGRFDGTDIIDILIQTPATPRRIATRLLRFFAAPEPPTEVVDEAAALLEKTRLDVKWFLRDLFQSRYFFSPACYRSRISSPAEFVVGTVRTLGVRWAVGRRSPSQMNEHGPVAARPAQRQGVGRRDEMDQLQHLGRPDRLRPDPVPAPERRSVRGEPRPQGPGRRPRSPSRPRSSTAWPKSSSRATSPCPRRARDWHGIPRRRRVDRGRSSQAFRDDEGTSAPHKSRASASP